MCPFHNEDTPSFIYNPKSYSCHCFGCGKTVDVLDAYMHSGKTYIEAAQALFEEADMKYAFGEAGVKTKAQYRYPHEEPINDKENVRKYLKMRAISDETIEKADVREDAHGNIAFNYYDTNDVLTMVKYRPSHKIDKSKGEIKNWCQKNADTTPLLFNMNRVNTNEPLLITEGECLPGYTEVLTPDGWVRLDKYKNQQVVQVNEDGEGNFVTPIAYVKHYYDGMMCSQINRLSHVVVTENHNIAYLNSDNKIVKASVADIDKKSISIPTVINVNGNGIPLTDEQIALWLAVSADCTIDIKYSTGHRHCRFCVKKDRKYVRMREILDKLEIPYFTSDSTRPGYHYIGFVTPKYIISKELPQSWVTQATLEQRKFIIEEMVNWDGNRVKTRNQYEYSSKEIHNATVMQAIAHTCGYTSSIIRRSNPHGSWYKVSILLTKNHISKQNPFKRARYHGNVYCVTVPTGMILVRQSEKIFVTGNCDTLAAIEAGYTNTVSVPFGANNYSWIEENFDWLEQFDDIIICSDNDEAGTKMQKECVFRLGSWRTKFIDIPHQVTREDGTTIAIKDLNEVLYYAGKESVMSLITNAKDSPVDSVSDFSDITSVDLDEIDGIKTGIESLDKKIMKLFYGSFNIITGVNGSGKSSFVSGLVSNAIECGQNTFLYSGELPNFQTKNWINYVLAGQRNVKEYSLDGSTYWKVTKDAQEKIDEYYRGRLFIYKDGYDHKASSLLKAMEDTTRKYGVKLHIIDNLTAVNLECSENNKYQKQEEFVTALIDFAKKYNVTVCTIIHPHKLETMRRLNKMDIQGISALIDLAHRIISLYRVTPDDKKGIPKNNGKGWLKEPIRYDVLCDILKDRMMGFEGSSVGLYYDKPSRRFFESEVDLDRQYSWDTETYNGGLPYPPLQLKIEEEEEEVYGRIEK